MSEIKKIIVEKTDGTTEIIEKGLIANFNKNVESTVTFNFVGIAGKDLCAIVMSIIALGERLGFFKEEEKL